MVSAHEKLEPSDTPQVVINGNMIGIRQSLSGGNPQQVILYLDEVAALCDRLHKAVADARRRGRGNS